MTDQQPNPRVVETTFRVRFAETDSMRVVHHSAYVIYLEEGRSEWGRQIGLPYTLLDELGYALAVAEMTLRYIASAKYDDLITVKTWADSIQSRGITYKYGVINATSQQLLVTAVVKLICVDKLGQVRRIPAEYMDSLQKAIAAL